MSEKQLWNIATVIGMAVILFFSVILGVQKGRAQAQTNAVMENESRLAQALEYFYNDQNRYPTAGEFSDQNIFGRYIRGAFPVPDIISKNCPHSFLYRRQNFQSYQLQYCLSLASGSSGTGWNKKTITK